MLASLLWTCAALGGAMLLMIYLWQDKLIYVPNIENSRHEFLDPAHFGLVYFDEFFVTTPDKEQIQVWLLKVGGPQESTKHPTMIYFHGNAGNISHRLPHIAKLISRVRCNVAIVSYRGYGRSTGYPHEAGIKLDAQAVLDYLTTQRDDIDPNKLFVFGSSLGGAVAIDLCNANQDRIKALVVENSFTSITDMVDCVMPALRYFKFLVTNPWNSLTKISNINVPTLFLSGAMDDLVPPWMMQKLYDACGAKFKRFVSFPNGGHVNTHMCSNYYTKMRQFIDEVFERTGDAPNNL